MISFYFLVKIFKEVPGLLNYEKKLIKNNYIGNNKLVLI